MATPFTTPGLGRPHAGLATTSPRAAIAPDCRHYRGDKPCKHNRLCDACVHYEPFTSRVCIIKLGALGDVIRTLCILPELRRKLPGAQITWVSLPNGCRMIGSHPLIDRVLPFGPMTAMTLMQEQFDTVISLDKEPEPAALAMGLFARQKLGIGMSGFGTPVPLNREAEPYFHLGLSDELKFRQNTKSYPRLVYEALGLQYSGQRYELPLDESASDRVRLMLAARGWAPGEPTLGINVGAGRVFANKMWPAVKIVELIERVRATMPRLQVLLLGGPDERTVIDRVFRATQDLGRVVDAGTEHDEPTFVALIDCCDLLFSGDTMAMHVAVARGKGAVVFMGPTCEREIDLFGKGEKLVADVACGPCYKRACDKDDACVKHHGVGEAVAAIARVLERLGERSHSLPVIRHRKAG
jgi:heptosyltransferase-2